MATAYLVCGVQHWSALEPLGCKFVEELNYCTNFISIDFSDLPVPWNFSDLVVVIHGIPFAAGIGHKVFILQEMNLLNTPIYSLHKVTSHL